MTKREFITMYVLLGSALNQMVEPPEDIIDRAIDAWHALEKDRRVNND